MRRSLRSLKRDMITRYGLWLLEKGIINIAYEFESHRKELGSLTRIQAQELIASVKAAYAECEAKAKVQ